MDNISFIMGVFKAKHTNFFTLWTTQLAVGYQTQGSMQCSAI